MKPIQTLARPHPGAVTTILAALVLALGGVGLVAPPFLDLEEAELQLDAAVRRLERLTEETRWLADARGEARIARLEAADQLLFELFPADVEAIDLYGAARLAADAAQVVLRSVQVSELREAELQLEPWIARRDIALRGRASLDALADVLAGVRALGYPSVVLELSIGREAEGEAFDFDLTIAAFQSAPDWRSTPVWESEGESEYEEDAP